MSNAVNPDIYFLKTGNNDYLIVSPLQQISACINSSAFQQIKAVLNNKKSINLTNNLDALLHDLHSFKGCDPFFENREIDPLFLGLIPTEGCNLKCRYCHFNTSGLPEQMDIKTAFSLVDWMIKTVKNRNRDTLKIHFFGGEPLTAMDFVSNVIHYARAEAARANLATWFEVTTNGVISPRTAIFIGTYFDAVVLSFDGFKKYHDKYRVNNNGKGSFDLVSATANILKELPVKLCFRICVTSKSVEELEQITCWFCKNFRPCVIDYEPLKTPPEKIVITDKTTAADSFSPPSPFLFAQNYLKAQKAAAHFGVEAVYSAVTGAEIRNSFCPVGQDTVIVFPDGRISSCYLPLNQLTPHGVDFNIGVVENRKTIVIDDEKLMALRSINKEKTRCSKCFCKYSCAGGCHADNTLPGCSDSYTDFCIQTRIISAFNILKSLGLNKKAEKFINNRQDQKRVARASSDQLIADLSGN